MIKTLKGEHHCGRDYSNRHATSTYLSNKFQAKVRDDSGCNIPGIVNETRRLFMLDISQKKAARTKQKALEALRGNDMEQCHKLRDYVATVKNFNPDSHISLQIDRRNVEERATFQRIYYGLGALKNALGRDANENMFPISFAVVEVENYDSWSWFLRELISQMGRGNKRMAYTFISDRQKSLVYAIEELFPESEHRFCLKHMFKNFKQRFKNQDLRDMFWKVAAAANMPEHETALANLARADRQEGDKLTAAEWFKRLPPKLWSSAHFSIVCRNDTCVNNMSESWNNYILKARGEPIITMLEWIRRRLMQRLLTKREGMLKHSGTLCPNIYEKLEKLKIKARNCVAVYGGNGNLEVDGYKRTNVVNLEMKTCTCGHFQLSGIPCVHVVACIQSRKLKFEDYVDACYHREVYLRAYNFTIGSVPSKQFWVDSKMQYLNPPLVKKQLGRPKNQRKKGPEEPTNQQKASRKGLGVYCRRCLKSRHNIRTCKSAIHPKSKLYKAPKVGPTASNATSVASVSQEPNQPISGANQESQQSRSSKRKQPAATARMSRLQHCGSKRSRK
ncbi:uncharacterized protein [Coffea arabica]|uniref:SWIM-type domain-containing protein n=1 Tax=Coffea arabica TaxID=13443 RepID=A0ABM4UYI7_COFAR